jgi:uncharacterized membrane protein
VKSWRTVEPWRPLGWAAVACGGAGYALLAHRAASTPAPGLLDAAVFIVPPMTFGLVLVWRSAARAAWLALWLAVAAALFLLRDRLAVGTPWMLLLQDVGINAALCLGFGRTLAAGSVPLVSRFAEIVHGPLSPRLMRYTRRLTCAWALFFGLTATASILLFALAPPVIWSAFVNLLSLPLLATMFAVEYLVRSLVLPRAERGGFFESLAAYRQFSRRQRAKLH